MATSLSQAQDRLFRKLKLLGGNFYLMFWNKHISIESKARSDLDSIMVTPNTWILSKTYEFDKKSQFMHLNMKFEFIEFEFIGS